MDAQTKSPHRLFDTQKELQEERRRQLESIDAHASYRVWPANHAFQGTSYGVRCVPDEQGINSFGDLAGLAADADEAAVEARLRQLRDLLNHDGRAIEVVLERPTGNLRTFPWKLAYWLEKNEPEAAAKKPAEKEKVPA